MFKNLKVGSQVTRVLAGSVRMPMVVRKIDDYFLYCDTIDERTGKYVLGTPSNIDDYWKFDKETGAEVDLDLGWTPTRSGSHLTHDN